MKHLTTVGLVALGVIVVLAFIPTEVEVQHETTEVIQEVDVLQVRIDTALKEAEAEIENTAKEAYDKVRIAEEQKIVDAVKADYIAELEATIQSVDY